MKTLLPASLALTLTLLGCGGKEEAAKIPPPQAPQPAAAMPSLGAAPDAPPPPGAAPVTAVVSGAPAGISAYEGKDEPEKLTKALHDYYERGGADVPIATSLEALVKAGYLKSVPVPPPGKKYVVTTTYPFQVRLENK